MDRHLVISSDRHAGLPAEYFKRNVKLGASCMPRREAELRYETGVDRILFGVDSVPSPEAEEQIARLGEFAAASG